MCPNALSPSLCCSSISGTCSSQTTIIDIHTPHNQHEENNNPIYTSTFLQSLSSHLDLLTAGSLFLLPSLLPFLASALTADSYSPSSSLFTPGSDPLTGAYVSPSPATSPDLVSGTTTTTTASSAWTWSTTWIMMLPCLGVMVPLSLFKLLAVLEERSKNMNGVECPYKRWRQSRAVTKRTRQSNFRHGAVDGPTLKAIKCVWRNLTRTTTSCVDDDNSRDILGYAPLPLVLAYQDEVNAEEGLCEKGMHNNHPRDNKVDFCSSNTASNIKNCRRQQQQVSALPRPKTILLASLWAWTLLMTLSAKMGFNTLEQTSVPPSFAVSSPLTQVPTNAIVGGSSAASGSPIFILPPALPFPTNLQTKEDDGEIDLRLWEPTSDLWSTEQQQQEESMSGDVEMVALLDMDIDVQFDATEEDEEAQPFARIQTNIVIINNNDNNNADTEPSFVLAEDEDIEDMSSLDAMIMDSQDEAAFHDFLHKLDQEDQALEQAQDQQRRKLLKATDDLMVSSMLDNDLPCGYYNGDRLFSDNKWLAGIQQFLVGDSTSAVEAGHFPGRTFVYIGWSTDLMIVAVAMCVGGVLVGLAQSKILYHQLLDQYIAASSFTTTSTSPLQRRGVSWTTLLASFSLSTSALALTFLMIADESWDVPAIYFVGIGISGIILVHAYVPNAALTFHSYQRDTADVSSSDNDDDDENTCIGSDNEYEDDSKLFSPVETSFVWSPPMAERRNACSLDENRRWEVVAAAATLHETNCCTR